jgi:predicted kinase
VQHLQGNATSTIYRDPATGEWIPERAALHESIIDDLLAGKQSKNNPKLWVVMGGVGSGKSTLIKSDLEPNHSDAVVLDADNLWLRIPEYERLAAANWRTAGDRTYEEVRYLRDAALAEATARRLNIILEISGDEHSAEVVNILEADGYEVSVNYVDCSPEVAQERIRQRANTNPTPEDNLWCSPLNPDLPDKYEYQNIDLDTFWREYERRRLNHKC